MKLPYKHIRHQAPVLASLGKTALGAVFPALAPRDAPHEIQQTIGARSPELVRDYIRAVGGDPAGYRGQIPAHMFPQWGFPLAAQLLRGLPYPMLEVLNGGCRIEIHRPLPLGEKLHVTARLADIDDDGRRAVLHQVVETGTADAPNAVEAHLYAIVPLARKGEAGEAKNGAAKVRPTVPHDARELCRWRLPADAGLRFAMLTGDFNPIHWVKRYARAAGFKSTILHGFATMAYAVEGLNRSLLSGDTRRLKTIDVKFTRPLLLPARVGLFIAGDQLWVGDSAGGPAYMTGTFSVETDDE